MPSFRRVTNFREGFSSSQTPFEHWYRDNTIYFITARTRDKFPAFASEPAKEIFWQRFDHWTSHYGFKPFVVTLLDNHYHCKGFLKVGANLGPMMQKFHGSVAKLVNDILPTRRLSFWKESGKRNYFDGCIRDEKQCRLAYRYTLLQSVRAGICKDWKEYPHTRVSVELEEVVRRAKELNAFMEGVRYKRYDG